MIWWSASLQRQTVQPGMRDSAGALSLAVDRELGGPEEMLSTLAASPYIEAGDVASLQGQVLRARRR